jgi:hypothetical protein
MIVNENVNGDRFSRCMTYGEFARAWDDDGSALHATRALFLELLRGFHPARKPVLWRVLIAQHLLYSALLRDAPLEAPPTPLSDPQIAELDWRKHADEADDAEIRAPVRAAEAYVAGKLADVAARLPPPTTG